MNFHMPSLENYNIVLFPKTLALMKKHKSFFFLGKILKSINWIKLQGNRYNALVGSREKEHFNRESVKLLKMKEK